jgi:hypothetical protein
MKRNADGNGKSCRYEGHNKSKILLCAITVQGRDDKAEKAEKWTKRSDD